jgi:hypothetical protein
MGPDPTGDGGSTPTAGTSATSLAFAVACSEGWSLTLLTEKAASPPSPTSNWKSCSVSSSVASPIRERSAPNREPCWEGTGWVLCVRPLGAVVARGRDRGCRDRDCRDDDDDPWELKMGSAGRNDRGRGCPSKCTLSGTATTAAMFLGGGGSLLVAEGSSGSSGSAGSSVGKASAAATWRMPVRCCEARASRRCADSSRCRWSSATSDGGDTLRRPIDDISWWTGDAGTAPSSVAY